MELNQSKTHDNLKAAWAGETQAHAKYLYFAEKARQQGLLNIADIFLETARNELAHSKIWYEMLQNGVGETEENLKNGIDGENYEWTQMYKEFANTAREEGFHMIADKFEAVGKIESFHEARYQNELKMLLSNTLYKREQPTIWICQNCGYIHNSDSAPDACPVCYHPKSYFKEQNSLNE